VVFGLAVCFVLAFSLLGWVGVYVCFIVMQKETSKKRFCSDKCRVYWHRKYPKGNTVSPVELASKFEVHSKIEQEPIKENKVSKNEPKEGSLAWFMKNS